MEMLPPGTDDAVDEVHRTGGLLDRREPDLRRMIRQPDRDGGFAFLRGFLEPESIPISVTATTSTGRSDIGAVPIGPLRCRAACVRDRLEALHPGDRYELLRISRDSTSSSTFTCFE